jgi:hypothetical protein
MAHKAAPVLLASEVVLEQAGSQMWAGKGVGPSQHLSYSTCNKHPGVTWKGHILQRPHNWAICEHALTWLGGVKGRPKDSHQLISSSVAEQRTQTVITLVSQSLLSLSLELPASHLKVRCYAVRHTPNCPPYISLQEHTANSNKKPLFFTIKVSYSTVLSFACSFFFLSLGQCSKFRHCTRKTEVICILPEPWATETGDSGSSSQSPEGR